MIRIAVTAVVVAFFAGSVPAHSDIKERAASIPAKAVEPLTGTFYTPDKSGPVPGILVLHTAAGLNEADRTHARNLAAEGYAALVVSYPIGWTDPVNRALAETIDWIRQQPESRNMPVGVIGFSLGGSKALLVAALRPAAVKAVVSYYGTYNVEDSKFRDAARMGRTKSGQSTPSPVETASRIGGAVLLLQGADDDETDPRQTAQMKAALERAKKTHQIVVFPGAVHMFEREAKYHPPGNRTRFGTVTGYQAAAARESWQKTVDWLKRHLPSSAR